MSDSFNEVTTEGYGQRLGGSLVAALFGIILVPVSVILLYWNEGRAVNAATALGRGASEIVEVSATAVDPKADGKLVHVTGMMQAATPARDPVFGVTGPGLVRLSRSVEMYQWKENKSSHSSQSVGGSQTTETNYTYEHVWSAQPIASGQFKVPGGHENPPMQLQSATFDGGTVTLGAYQVDPSLLGKVTDFSGLQPQSAPPADYRVAGDAFYHGQDANQPAVGDVRVTFSAIPAQTISVAAAQSGGVLTAFHDANGYSIALAEPGVAPAAALFQDAEKSAGRLTWILRGVGFGLMLIGFICMTRPLTMLFAVLPFLESIVGTGAFLVAFTLAVPITLLTIGIAWFAHRPLVGGGLLVAAVAALVLLRRLHPRRAARLAAP
jgi:Transmembrane protein 43